MEFSQLYPIPKSLERTTIFWDTQESKSRVDFVCNPNISRPDLAVCEAVWDCIHEEHEEH